MIVLFRFLMQDIVVRSVRGQPFDFDGVGEINFLADFR